MLKKIGKGVLLGGMICLVAQTGSAVEKKSTFYGIFSLGFEQASQTSDVDGDVRESRLETPFLLQFGSKGVLGEWGSAKVTYKSEFRIDSPATTRGANGDSRLDQDANAGLGKISVREQWVNVDHGDFSWKLGRITDSMSVNYFGWHVNNSLNTPLGPNPSLWQGFNRGNGVEVGYKLDKNLKFQVMVNAGRPGEMTGPEFPALYGGAGLIWLGPEFASNKTANADKSVDTRSLAGHDARIFAVSPALEYKNSTFKIKAQIQNYTMNPSIKSDTDDTLSLQQTRFSAAGKFLVNGMGISPIFSYGAATMDTSDGANKRTDSSSYSDKGETSSWSFELDLDMSNPQVSISSDGVTFAIATNESKHYVGLKDYKYTESYSSIGYQKQLGPVAVLFEYINGEATKAPSAAWKALGSSDSKQGYTTIGASMRTFF